MLIGDVILAMRIDAFQAVMNHDMSFFDRYQSGRIVSRITSDTDEFGRVAVLITEVFTQLLLVFILVFYLFRIDVRLTIVLVLVAPVAFIIAIAFQRIARRVTRRSQQAMAEVNVSIQEAVTGISVAKNFRREQGIYDEFLAVNDRATRSMSSAALCWPCSSRPCNFSAAWARPSCSMSAGSASTRPPSPPAPGFSS